ncbi:hypothetical protein L7F22_030090 [Adiantum nelumboides]|nr:hypothetical protein [Adiantum nelumboides]
MSEQERRVGRVYYTRAQARAGNPDIDPFHYDDAPEREKEVCDNEQEQLLNQGTEGSVRAFGRSEQQESELVIIQQTDEQDVHQEGWYCDCYQCGQVEEAEALAVTRAKSKGPINWKDQKDVKGKVHEKVQKEQIQYAEEENEELEIPKKQQKLDKADFSRGGSKVRDMAERRCGHVAGVGRERDVKRTHQDVLLVESSAMADEHLRDGHIDGAHCEAGAAAGVYALRLRNDPPACFKNETFTIAGCPRVLLQIAPRCSYAALGCCCAAAECCRT